jgi:hypothetical protein
MNNVQKTIEALKEAEKFLDQHISDPKNYNDPMSIALEIISWDINKKISELQERLIA